LFILKANETWLKAKAFYYKTDYYVSVEIWQDYRSKLFLKMNNMGGLLYLIAVILIIGWLLGFFAFHLGGLIHILLVIAIIAILLRLIGGSRI